MAARLWVQSHLADGRHTTQTEKPGGFFLGLAAPMNPQSNQANLATSPFAAPFFKCVERWRGSTNSASSKWLIPRFAKFKYLKPGEHGVGFTPSRVGDATCFGNCDKRCCTASIGNRELENLVKIKFYVVYCWWLCRNTKPAKTLKLRDLQYKIVFWENQVDVTLIWLDAWNKQRDVTPSGTTKSLPNTAVRDDAVPQQDSSTIKAGNLLMMMFIANWQTCTQK